VDSNIFTVCGLQIFSWSDNC